MATIDSREMIDQIIENNGIYPGDEDMPIAKIVEYTTYEGNRTWGVVYVLEVLQGIGNRYEEESSDIRDPVVIFRRTRDS